jgi:hypothetical protein
VSKSINIQNIVLKAVLAILISGFPMAVQGKHPAGQESDLTYVRDFLSTFYPEAFGKKNMLNQCIVQPADSSWREISGVYFRITPPSDVELNPFLNNERIGDSRLAPSVSTLSGTFWLRPGHSDHIQQVIVSDELVQTERLNAARKLIEAHPEWSEEQILRTLSEAGALYLPKDKSRFVSSLHFERAERFMGHLDITSVEFGSVVNKEHIGNFALLIWTIKAEAKFPDGTRCRYFLAYEPFGGKLIQIERHD